MNDHTRRQYLNRIGTGMAVTQLIPDIIESEPATHPPYPRIPSEILDHQGWELGKRWRDETDEALVSASTYKWPWLRELVKEETDGMIDIPMGGLIALRIGNDGETYRWNGRTLRNGRTFTSVRWAKGVLREEMREIYKTFVEDFLVGQSERKGGIPWKDAKLFPTEISVLADVCTEGGALNTELEGQIKLNQHNFDYELTEDTANVNRSVDLATERSVKFYGWNRAFGSDGQIYVVGAIYPKTTGDYCGIAAPHIERALSDALGTDVDLDLDTSLTARVRTVMGAVH